MCRSHKQSKQQQKEEEAKGGERKAREGEEYRQKWRNGLIRQKGASCLALSLSSTPPAAAAADM